MLSLSLHLRQRTRVAGQDSQLPRNGKDLVGSFPQARDARKSDLFQPQAFRQAHLGARPWHVVARRVLILGGHVGVVTDPVRER